MTSMSRVRAEPDLRALPPREGRRLRRGRRARPDVARARQAAAGDRRAGDRQGRGRRVPGDLARVHQRHARRRCRSTTWSTAYIKPRLQTLTGVADVRIFGERKNTMRVWLDPRQAGGLSADGAGHRGRVPPQNVEMPAGRIESQQREFRVVVADRPALARAVRRDRRRERRRLSGADPRRRASGGARRRRAQRGVPLQRRAPRFGRRDQARRRPIRSTCRRRARDDRRRSSRTCPTDMKHRRRQRQVGVHREVDQERVSTRSSRRSCWWCW